MYSEEQRRYLHLSNNDHALLDSIHCRMAAGSVDMNRCVCMLNNSVDTCLLDIITLLPILQVLL